MSMTMTTYRQMPTMEECKAKRDEIDRKINELRAQKEINKTIIKDKQKGKIRSAQRENNEIREEIQRLQRQREVWLNGGVW